MSVVNEFHLVTSKEVAEDVNATTVTLVRGTQFNVFRHFKNCFVAFQIIRRIKPTVVFSTGGPICIPYAIVAKLMGVNFVYLDTLSRVVDLSNTARFLYKYKMASKIMCQWENVAAKYPGVEYFGKTFDICNDRH
jgi:UDP-N-acetylglucosamine:LPS N-acetylglucosamine transferase